MLVCSEEREIRYVSGNVVEHVRLEVFIEVPFDVYDMSSLSGSWTDTHKVIDSSLLLILEMVVREGDECSQYSINVMLTMYRPDHYILIT